MTDANMPPDRDALEADVKPRLICDEAEQLRQLVRHQSKLQDEQTALAESKNANAPRLGNLSPEQERLLPRVGSGVAKAMVAQVLLLLILAVCLAAFVSAFPAIEPSRSIVLLALLPLQLYWAFCLRRIGQVMGQLNGGVQPFSMPLIIGASAVSLVCGYYGLAAGHFEHTLPQALTTCLWTMAQLIVPFVGGTFLQRLDNSQKKSSDRLALTAAAPTLIVVALAYLDGTGVLAFSTWALTQFWAIHIIKKYLRLGSGRPAPRVAAAPPVQEPAVAFVNNEVIVRYRAFPAIERWMRHRVNKTLGLPTRVKWVLAYSLGFLALLSLWKLAAMVQVLSMPSANGQMQASINLAFVMEFLRVTAVAVLGIMCVKLAKPTHALLSDKGIKFLWRHKLLGLPFKRDGQFTAWQDVRHISMKRKEGKTSPLDDVLTFSTGAAPHAVRLSMGSIDSVEARQAILQGIQKWGGDISRDANVIESLQPPADHSYTELWLQALAAPPKRERLKPLMPQALLRDGHYLVQGSIGVGGQGQAYLANDTRDGQSVVLKEFILPVYVDVSVRRSALEQFENEARILRQLNHPQIVQLRDFFVEDHRAYLVLEHIEGASLRSIVEKNGKLGESQVRLLARQMCDILSYLHGLEPQVVHRDFTPDNLILDVNGQLKLIDFNVAKQLENTTVGTVVGKYAYLPPEQFRGTPCTQSDIYAFGATLHYLLTGADPEPISVSRPMRLDATISPAMDEVVSKATAIDLGKRYQDVKEIKCAFDSSETSDNP